MADTTIVEPMQPFDEIKKRIQKLKQDVELWREASEDSKGMNYLHLKNHLLLSYVLHKIYYARMQEHREPGPEHVDEETLVHCKAMVKIRMMLEKLRPMDKKLKYQVEKMLQLASANTLQMDESLQFGPNPDALMSKLDDEEPEADRNTSTKVKSDGLYRVPKIAAVPYEEQVSTFEREKKLREKQHQRLKNSTILSELRDELTDRPSEVSTSGTNAVTKALSAERQEKKNYEEARFVRLVTSRKDKIRIRESERDAQRVDSVADIEAFDRIHSALQLRSSDRQYTRNKEGRKPTRASGKSGGIFAHISPHDHASASASGKTKSKRPIVSSSSHAQGKKNNHNPQAGRRMDSDTTTSTKKKQKVVFGNLFD